MVVGQANHHQPRNAPLGQLQPEVPLKLIHPILVGNAHVEGRIAPVGRLKNRLGQRRIQKQPLAFRLRARRLVVALQFQSLAVVQNTLTAGRCMLPQRTELWLVLWHRRIRSAKQRSPAGLLGAGKLLAPSAVARTPRGVEERRGIDAHNPAMPVRRHIRVDIKVVAHPVLFGNRMQIRRHLQVRHRLVLCRPAIHSVARQRRVPIRARHIAQHLIVGAVLANNKEAVLQPRQRGPSLNRRRVAVNHRPRQHLGRGQFGQVNRAHAAVLQRAHIGRRPRIVPLTRIRARALALGVHHIQNRAVGREGNRRGIPAHRNVLDNFHRRRVHHTHRVNAGLRHIDTPLLHGNTARHHTAQWTPLHILEVLALKRRQLHRAQ